MENKIFTKFNLYDQIGYLMVGTIAVMVIVFNFIYFYQVRIISFNLDNFLIWFITTYFIGHFIQGICNIINEIPILNLLIKEKKEEFNSEEKALLQQAKSFFKLKEQNKNKLWNYCYMLACAKDATGQVTLFNAYYSLYRGWLTIFFLQSLFLLYFLITKHNIQIFILFLLSIFLSLVFYKRSKRFWKYLRNKVFDTFILVKALNL